MPGNPVPEWKTSWKVQRYSTSDYRSRWISAAVEAAAREEDERKESKYEKDLVQLNKQGKKISPD